MFSRSATVENRIGSTDFILNGSMIVFMLESFSLPSEERSGDEVQS
jgi:hypothetical protein